MLALLPSGVLWNDCVLALQTSANSFVAAVDISLSDFSVATAVAFSLLSSFAIACNTISCSVALSFVAPLGFLLIW